MGRGKIEIKKIENLNNRQVTFSKRRAGLLKKARELSVLCDAEVAVIIFSSTGRLFEYASQSMQRTIARYNKSVDQRETKEEPDHEAFQASLVTADATFTPEVQLLTNVEKPYADKEKEKETVKDKENNKEKEKDKANEKLKEKEKEKKNHEAKELDILKQEIENLKLKQSQLLGNDLSCVGLKELLQLEQQLNQALISIKNKKEQILMNQLERAKAKEEQMKLENTTLREQVQELLGKIPPNGHALPLYLDYPSELYNPAEKDGIGSADTICNDEVANEYSDTTLQLGPPSGISRKRKAPEGESHCSHFGSGM